MTCIEKIKKRLDEGESVDLRGAYCAHCQLVVASIFETTAISHMTVGLAREALPCLREKPYVRPETTSLQHLRAIRAQVRALAVCLLRPLHRRMGA